MSLIWTGPKRKSEIIIYFFSNISNICGRGTLPQASDTFGLNPTSQLVIGYHWLAFLNQIRTNLQVPET